MDFDEPAPPPPEFPNRIRSFRKRARLSLEELAPMAGVSFQTLQRWETKHPKLSLQQVEKLAKALGTDAYALLPYIERPLALTEEEQFLLKRYRLASESERRSILRSVRGLTDRDDEPFLSRK